MNKVLLVGCGHMGSALLSSWYQKINFNFFVIDPKRYKILRKKYSKKVTFFKTIKEIDDLKIFDIIIFAVKPQIVKEVLKKFSFNTNKKILFISIVAGKQISFFNTHLGPNKQIVRIMPNMPAFVEKGMSCLFASKNISKKNKQLSTMLFNKVGKTLWLKKESDMDKITAISGSGPAYYFLFVQCLESVASDLGFNTAIARDLVYQTAFGSMVLLLKDKRTAKQLKESIAIKGGTTEAAINVFEKKSIFKKIIKNAVQAAYLKSLKLRK